MHDWNFVPDHPISLSLAADARLCETDYTNDQIWELNFGNSEPASISLQTTFGLRARFCRIFPRFILNSQVINDPKHFHHPITIHQYFPNYINLSFKPFSSINVILEYWVPNSHTIACKTEIINLGRESCQFQIEWAELLAPAGEGNRMSIKEIGLSTILAGETTKLIPVLFLTGGAQSGKSPYPSLNLSCEIAPKETKETQWAHAALPELNASYELAKEVMHKNWDIEFAQLSRMNSNRLEILTGNQDWDTAIYLSQTLADQFLLQPTPSCKSTSFVTARNPDQGYSLLKDGSDYNYMWNGQTPLDSYYLTNFLLPSSPGIVKGLVDNFLATQTQQGDIDIKPGLGGQRSQLLATPLLAYISWKLYEYTSDVEYLNNIFSKLLSFFFAWFTDSHDRDQDSIPEWDQAVQTGFEENPLFSYHAGITGVLDISTVESPDLCSFLYQECMSLINIANEIVNIGDIDRLEQIAHKLREAVENSWDDNQACFSYRDRDSHISAPSVFLGKLKGAGVIELHQEFPDPIRPMIQIRSNREGTRPVQIFIHGSSTSGTHRVDHAPAYQIHWHLNTAHYTSDYIYKTIEQIEVTGILPDDEVIVETPAFSFADHTLLLPLWAGIPSKDKAKILINLSIMNKKKFLCPYGIRSVINFQNIDEASDEFSAIHLPWIGFIVDGMLQYGEGKKAAEVFTRMMKAIIHTMNTDLTLHRIYHSETGKPSGTSNSLDSLIPIGTFLNIVGVKIINSSKVAITGSNPFPWPVTIKYRGLTVVQQEKKAVILFSDGQNITVDNTHPQIISIE